MTATEQTPGKNSLESRVGELWPVVAPKKFGNEEQHYSALREIWEVYVDPPDSRYLDVLATVTLVSHRVRDFDTMPHVHLYGPKDSGKTTILRLFQRLAEKPLLVSSVSVASIFQVVSSCRPTLLFDECDRLSNEQSEYVSAMLQILNVYSKETRVIRGSREGSDPQLYDVYGLKILATTEPLAGTLPDRAIRLDMEHNVRKIPVKFDEERISEIRSQLEYYHAIHNVKTFTPTVDIEQLNEQIQDNRTTQLFYPLIETCPTAEGRTNLLSLALDRLSEKRGDEESSELARVLESVIRTWNTAGRPQEISVKDILAEYNSELEPTERIKSPKLGWRLKKLQISRTHTEKGSVARIDPRKIYRLARRYTPLMARILSDSSDSSGPSQNTPPVGQLSKFEIPSRTDKADETDDNLGKGQPTVTVNGSRIDMLLLRDYICTKGIQVEQQSIGYATTEKVEYHCSIRFGPDVKGLVIPQLTVLVEQGRIQPGPFHDTWKMPNK